MNKHSGLLASVLALSVSLFGFAQFVDAAPRRYKVVNSTTETMICVGHCALIGYWADTGAATATALLRDTDTADGGGTDTININYESGSSGMRFRTFGEPVSSFGWSVKSDSTARLFFVYEYLGK